MKDDGLVKEIPKKSENFSDWYTAVVLKAGLADYAPIRGCMVIRPHGYGIWENIQQRLDARFKATGHVNACFPTMVPESFFRKEARHVEGFAPEAWWVTHRGADKLEERLALRPTSEAVINAMFARWVKSWRDLPVLMNQWCNIFRAEKATRLFLRTSEFLWQEGHTLHRTEAEAEEETLKILDLYLDFLKNDLALPVLAGFKPESEKFAGADRTYTMEAMMPDGQALQAGTSHNLGQGFARAFEIKYLDENNTEQHPWGTSWGVSTRLIGALVMTHGDDRGLFLPPKVAPIQAAIVPILFGRNDTAVLDRCREARAALDGIRVRLDDATNQTAGWKFNQYEMLGVPVRVEIGPKDVEKQGAVLVPRDGSGKRFIKFAELRAEVESLLDEVQSKMYDSALARLRAMMSEAGDFDEFRRKLAERPGFVKVAWCGTQDCENRIIGETKTTPRVMVPAEQDKGNAPCIACGRETGTRIHYARTY
ncbi:MAG TPA: proline--tRNA ligase [candidate division WOR-3 bacterium]|uniref:Proline--tRNA ligase n=1 Tax=candidate division WOR-3 bacterium TaxID=2052148 RepID=A0A7V0XF93_UNCW3|nr:proline--tRNA ligase [candidate division WOR-3 bacterium]